MIVLDASVMTDALTNAGTRGVRTRAALARDPEWAVPEHWMVEVFSAIRGLTAGGKITADAAARAFGRLHSAEVATVATTDLLDTMCAVRNAISPYDAPYVALANRWQLTLLTSDAPLSRAALGYCRVELV
jgi:predicted nucleic acid-binding protein